MSINIFNILVPGILMRPDITMANQLV